MNMPYKLSDQKKKSFELFYLWTNVLSVQRREYNVEPGPHRWKARAYPCACLSKFSTYGVMLILSLFSLQLTIGKTKKEIDSKLTLL